MRKQTQELVETVRPLVEAIVVFVGELVRQRRRGEELLQDAEFLPQSREENQWTSGREEELEQENLRLREEIEDGAKHELRRKEQRLRWKSQRSTAASKSNLVDFNNLYDGCGVLPFEPCDQSLMDNVYAPALEILGGPSTLTIRERLELANGEVSCMQPTTLELLENVIEKRATRTKTKPSISLVEEMIFETLEFRKHGLADKACYPASSSRSSYPFPILAAMEEKLRPTATGRQKALAQLGVQMAGFVEEAYRNFGLEYPFFPGILVWLDRRSGSKRLELRAQCVLWFKTESSKTGELRNVSKVCVSENDVFSAIEWWLCSAETLGQLAAVKTSSTPLYPDGVDEQVDGAIETTGSRAVGGE